MTATSGVASVTGAIVEIPPECRNVVVSQESRDLHAGEEERSVQAEAYADTLALVRSENRVLHADAEVREVSAESGMDTSIYVVAEPRGFVVEYEEREVLAEACDVQMA